MKQRSNGRYWCKKQDGHVVDNVFNDTGEPIRFWSGCWGPHGEVRPGQWVSTDAAGFSLAIDESAFDEWFEPLSLYRRIMLMWPDCRRWCRVRWLRFKFRKITVG